MQELFKPVPRAYSIGLWLAAGALACLLCLYHLSATLVDGAFLPADHDSFYHARRILDAMADPLRMYQFDPLIHAPDGAWVTWPWAYDMLMAIAARGLVALTGARDPMTVLAFVAPAWAFVNGALFLGIASRLRLSLPMQVFAMLFFATSPLTQALHRVGMLDHHYIEYTFVLASIYVGLGWFEDLANRRHAAALALLLGAAPAFHNGLFILQLPTLVTLGCLWIMQRPIDRGGALTFAATLIAATALFLAPSEPFRNGEFSYYLQSWFHLYIAFCTALLCALAGTLRFTPAAAAGTCVLAALLAVPVLGQLQQGRDFIFGLHPYLRLIAEFGSIPGDIAAGHWRSLTAFYSPLLWLLPLGVGWLLLRLRRDARNASVYFAVQALFGAFLMLQMFRLHYFGSFALILPLCRLIDDLRPALFASRPRALALGVLAAASLVPGLESLRNSYVAGSSSLYAASRPVYAALAEACRSRPGTVLAEPNDGHFIRYHTACSNIADNFLITPDDFERLWLTEAMMTSSTADILSRAPYVRYILVRRADDFRAGDGCGLACQENHGLRGELLTADQAPRHLRLLTDLHVRRAGRSEPLVRLYEVVDSK